tara:strand:+ start:17 stop:1471 length:1455 start_codon:yes stop_codon:yes gene_type:complete
MVLNPFFTQGTLSEQNLVQDLINEQLRTYGVDIFYLPRKYMTENTVIREVVQSKFDMALPLEAYIDNYDQYSGAGNILSKFGIQSQDEVRLIISKERFENYITPLIEDQANVKLSTRPKGGDLIWFPLDDRIYEIKDVEYAKPYYQLQNLYVYELYCELFRIEDEIIATGIEEVDNNLIGEDYDGQTDDGINTIQGPTQSLTLVGSGVTAAAAASILNGGVRFFSITNRGGGYSVIPTVGVTSAPAGGTNAVGIATMIGGINVCNLNANEKLQSVQAVNVANAGTGYTVAPTVKFIVPSGQSGSGAAATTVIGDGIVGIITVTSGGGGYTASPTISFTNEVFKSGVTTASATALAIVSTAGTISAIHITNAGLGYSTTPTISVGSPESSGSGTFAFNEIVTGSSSGTTARVRTWNATTNVLEVGTVTGEFTIGEDIVGQTSGASYSLRVTDTQPADDGFADNINIETEADSIIDFSEQNPFGMP